LDLFGDFITKGENVGPKQASVSKNGKRQAMCEHRMRRSKRGKFDPGGVLGDGKHPSKCKRFQFCQFLQIYACFACVVINHQKGGPRTSVGVVMLENLNC
jgi:hypothetical protein